MNDSPKNAFSSRYVFRTEIKIFTKEKYQQIIDVFRRFLAASMPIRRKISDNSKKKKKIKRKIFLSYFLKKTE